MKNAVFFQEVCLASEMIKSKWRNRIDLCDFLKFMLIFKPKVIWIDMIYNMFNPPLVHALLRDELVRPGEEQEPYRDFRAFSLMKNPVFFQEVCFASEMIKSTGRNRIDLCDFSEFLLDFQSRSRMDRSDL